jgi:5-methylcytosine-specific restriction endonuclease McrA
MTKRQPPGHPQNSTKYKKLRREFMRRQGRFGVCSLCGELVDMALSGRQSLGPTVDHRVASTAGGAFFDLSNWQLAHRRCNNRKGRGEAIGAGGRRFAPDGHWKDKPTGREPASPNDVLGCDNDQCAFCLEQGYR